MNAEGELTGDAGIGAGFCGAKEGAFTGVDGEANDGIDTGF